LPGDDGESGESVPEALGMVTCRRNRHYAIYTVTN
jgi:hypothetical protein